MSLAKATKVKIAGFAVSAALVTGLAAVGSGATGAYFSDTKAGAITGSVGTIHIQTSGGVDGQHDGLDFQFDNLMPGEPQTANIHYKNTGSQPEDVYLTFPNATALSALNSLGTYGEVHIGSNGTEIYANANLNDKPNNGTSGVPSQLKVASNVAPGVEGDVSFRFNYASKLGTASHSSGGGDFNSYPVPGQVTTVAGQTGSGLPFQVVATQVGQTP